MRIRRWSIMVMTAALAACGSGGGDGGSSPTEPARNSQPSAAAAQRIEVAGPERHILAFGDSLFAGYGVGLESSYPTKLETALRQAGINAIVTNAAISGETSGAGAQRLAFTLDAQKTKPDLVLLELGGNDMLRAIPPEATRANFEAMLTELKQRDIPVLLMGMRAPPNYGPEYQRDFDAIYGDLARQYGVALIPFWLESIYQNPKLFQDDRIHPTVEGIDTLVAATRDAVKQAIPQD